MKTGSPEIPLNCSIVVPICRSIIRALMQSMKSITLKINGQTFKYEIKAQALKDTSLIRPHYLARFFCAKSIKQPQLLLTNWLLFCLIVRKEERHFI